MSKDTFTLEQIEKAWYKSANWDEMEDRLRPEPKFSEWQVVQILSLVDGRDTCEYIPLSPDDLAPYQAHKLKNCRPLNQSEVGEGWISTEKYDSLVEKYSQQSEKYMELADKYSDLIGIKESADKLAITLKNITDDSTAWSFRSRAGGCSLEGLRLRLKDALSEYSNGQEGL